MSIVTVYRAFRTRCHAVYEREIDDLAVLAMKNAGTPYIDWMLQIPTVFTKRATPALARELGLLPFNESLEALTIIIEAYPASFHCGSTPELGILISINHTFKIGKNEKQANWKYDHVYIVEPGLGEPRRTRRLLKELPRKVKV